MSEQDDGSKPPFKRGQKLEFVKDNSPCKYVKWFGVQRPNYVIVELPDGRRVTTFTNELRAV